jgi:hypothetical protein
MPNGTPTPAERPSRVNNLRPMCSVLVKEVPKTHCVHYSWSCSCSTSHILNAWNLPLRLEITAAMSAMSLSGADDEHRDERARKSGSREDS